MLHSIDQAKKTIGQVIIGKDEIIELLFTALLSDGHVLLESVPGSGKTKLAKSFAKIMNGQFSRVQFTPDVLPSDVTGIQFFNPKTQEFELREGPVMTNVLLADEVNRATPKTQSSLLEVMEEKQTTVDGETLHMTPPFFVIATQNPVEGNHGTFPLPEAQLDRFLFKLNMGYPSMKEEKDILNAYRLEEPLQALRASLEMEEVLQLREEVKKITVAEDTVNYLLDLVRLTRNHPDIELGVSTRGALVFMRAVQARALLKERSYVTPNDVKVLVPYVFGHRIVLSMEGSLRKTTEQVVAEIIEQVPVPVEAGENS
ncbi:MoxR family ATPase [Halobacillus shinanisalinarum]|uniref:MoxR family ATPase n=1 Tax=Halobacillus shinanisalinarum TaxID=2932258 RepID=A0ABY4H1H2_9BACI|nr:MoxR family ATPase [Halobacillus shinanisalinarum]UOQ94286.1 MoxR family ATPase [Halobacillus shinanisalinarum]